MYINFSHRNEKLRKMRPTSVNFYINIHLFIIQTHMYIQVADWMSSGRSLYLVGASQAKLLSMCYLD